MKAIAILAAGLALTLGTSSQALAWGEAGHELIGAIAQSILEQQGHAKASKEVKRILNLLGKHTLSEAATWADCARSVIKTKNDQFLVQYNQKTSSAAQICKDAFPQENENEAKAMTDYVERNWSKCDYVEDKKGSGDCHKSYHFADIRISDARKIIANPSDPRRHVQGKVVQQAASYNPSWSFHLAPDSVAFFEMQIEVCDANVTYVQAHLDEVGGSFLPKSLWCPWSSWLAREVR